MSPGIAIIGLACRFPGAATPREFWHNLCSGVESITSIADSDLHRAGVPGDLLRDPHYVKAAPILRDVEHFDADFFQLSPREAALMDPQQRIFLECAWEALEDAACEPLGFPGSIGLFAGAGGSLASYLLAHADAFRRHLGETGGVAHLGNDKDFLASRVSFKLNLRGPSITVQTACSTSLVAVHLACQSLLGGECDVALAGGVTVRVPHRVGYRWEEGGLLSPDGHCRPFSARAQGTIFGSGAGVVVLKPLARAQEDRDHIYAVIRGSAVNNDGSNKLSYTASSVEGQARAMAEALAVADVSPASIEYVEAHGTATYLGDPLEVDALTRAFRGEPRWRSCAIGSVKSNIGHLEAAAGVAGLVKTVLALQQRRLPPSLHGDEPSPRIDFVSGPFHIQDRLAEWESEGPRRAGVNSLGIGGTNAFVVLEEAPEPARKSRGPASTHLLCLSARTESALHDLIERYECLLESDPNLDLADLCFTANTGRTHFRHRLAVRAGSTMQLLDTLKQIASGLRPTNAWMGNADRVPPAPAETWPFDGANARDHRLEGLARRYTAGGEVDWHAFYRGQVHHKLPLPTYPFQRRRHWITDLVETPTPVRPFGTVDVGTLALPFLAEHRIYGRVVVPGALFASLALATAARRLVSAVLVGGPQEQERPPAAIDNLAFLHPLVLSDSPGASLQLVDDRDAFRILGGDTVHVTGTWADVDAGSPEPMTPLTFQAGRSERSSDGFYRHYEELGLDLGPTFRRVQRLWTAREEVFAEITAPDETIPARFALHPALLDACFQVGMAAAQDSDELFIPWHIERLVLRQRPTARIFCRASRRPGTDTNRETLTVDLDVLDPAGNVLIEVHALTLKRAGRAALMRNRQAAMPQSLTGAVRVTIAERGRLDRLRLDEVRCPPPGAGEVQVAVRAAGLNFRDVLNALGLYPGDAGPPGMECAGIVNACGFGVMQFRAGDAVFGFARDCLGSIANVPADLLVPMPEGFSFEQAASIPVVFATASLGLERLADVHPGERVLIHAAAGGVGLAALQIARRRGAEILATASAAKWDYLGSLGVEHLFDSRSLDFAGGVMRATGGKGVHVVLNSLSGDFIPRSLATLAPGGRFVEIGKQGIWNAEQVAAIRPDVAYHVLALDRMIEDGPAAAGAVLRELLPRFESGELEPLLHTAFPLSQAAAAFRMMQQARHVGKLVLTVAGMKPASLTTAASSSPANLRTHLEGAAPEGRIAILTGYLQEKVGRMLALDPARPPDPRTPFLDLGLDSLMTVELRGYLKSDLGPSVPLSQSLTYDHPTIETLSRHLADLVK